MIMVLYAGTFIDRLHYELGIFNMGKISIIYEFTVFYVLVTKLENYFSKIFRDLYLFFTRQTLVFLKKQIGAPFTSKIDPISLRRNSSH